MLRPLAPGKIEGLSVPAAFHPRRPSPADAAWSGPGNTRLKTRPTSDPIQEPHLPSTTKTPGKSPNENRISAQSSGSTAKQWFKHSNKHSQTTPGEDNEPPFYQHHSSNDSCHEYPDGNAIAVSTGRHPPNTTPMSMQSATNGSSSDDFRSVIDDLTIENKMLREQLRRYRKHESAHLNEEKLFEIKIHSLPAPKTRELLNYVAIFLQGEGVSSDSMPAAPSRDKEAQDEPPERAIPSSNRRGLVPQLSHPRLGGDSAYASMSGPTSVSTLNHVWNEKKTAPVSRSVKDKQLGEYLHNAPGGSLAKPAVQLSERAKKKLVVRRLEQIFTGKGEIVELNSQSMQQEEVSKSAASIDRGSMLSTPLMEGVREAHIQPFERPMLDSESQAPRLQLENSVDSQDVSDESSIERSSPEQRPTRPRDLDPNRAQNPAENIEYIWDLTHQRPDLGREDYRDATPDADGWIYLNFLANLAQLHTINVTPNFIRAAVSEVSEKFQLSHDGHKLRWRGGTTGTRLGSDSGTSSVRTRSSNDSDSIGEGSRKRRKLSNHILGASRVRQLRMTDPLHQWSPSHPLHYKPLFRRRGSSIGDLGSSEESDSLSEYGAKGGKRGYSGQPRLGPGEVNQHSKGPIVFYKGAKFFTDLSGDQAGFQSPSPSQSRNSCFTDSDENQLAHNRKDDGPAHITSGFSISTPQLEDSAESYCSHIEDSQPQTPDLIFHMDDGFVEETPRSCNASPEILDLVASGLGDTRPADHFVIKVKTRHVKSCIQSQASGLKCLSPSRTTKFWHRIPPSSLELFARPDPQSIVENITARISSLRAHSPPSLQQAINPEDLPVKAEVLETSLKILQPSALPEGVGYYASDSDSELSSSVSSSGVSHLRLAKVAGLSSKPLPCVIGSTSINREAAPGGVDGDDETDTREDGSDDSSIDMLAHARELDPAFVRAKEQEFEMEIDRQEKEDAMALITSTVATVDDESLYTDIECSLGDE